MNSELRNACSDSTVNEQFVQQGFHITERFLTRDECDALAKELSVRFDGQQMSAKSPIGGVRNLLHTSKCVARLVSSEKLTSFLGNIAGKSAFAVRAIFFDKTEDNNWSVPWHQDLAISVAERVDAPGFGGWSLKDGVVHVHPPQEVLKSMVTLRLHLDDCDSQNGALHVLPGSHRCGKMGAAEINDWVQTHETMVCEVPKGGVLLMRPLLLHSSLRSENPTHRRVLHLEFAAHDLPNGLKWCAC
jgi:ectoine hydroxylase-related dioxygenase (phytanoyl-CoA dioxygenase family)